MADIVEQRPLASRKESPVVENPPGIFRTTLSYNQQSMLCHFSMKQGARIPLHHHAAVQNGYVVSGRVRFQRQDGSTFEASAGTAYTFGPDEPHAAEVLQDSEVVEFFAPMRPEYALPAGR